MNKKILSLVVLSVISVLAISIVSAGWFNSPPNPNAKGNAFYSPSSFGLSDLANGVQLKPGWSSYYTWNDKNVSIKDAVDNLGSSFNKIYEYNPVTKKGVYWFNPKLYPGRVNSFDVFIKGNKYTIYANKAVVWKYAEVITLPKIERDGSFSVELNNLKIKDGEVSINLLYGNGVTFTGVGKSDDSRLITSNSKSLIYYEKKSGMDYGEYFVASSYVPTKESYLLRAKVSYDSTFVREEVTIEKYANGGWIRVCEEKTNGSTCDIGDVSLTLDNILYQSGGDESVTISSENTVFSRIYDVNGNYLDLPSLNTEGTYHILYVKNSSGEVIITKYVYWDMGKIVVSDTPRPGSSVTYQGVLEMLGKCGAYVPSREFNETGNKYCNSVGRNCALTTFWMDTVDVSRDVITGGCTNTFKEMLSALRTDPNAKFSGEYTDAGTIFLCCSAP